MARSRKRPERWQLWGQLKDGMWVKPDPRTTPTQGRPPKKAERSGDGNWATVFGGGGDILEVWVRTI